MYIWYVGTFMPNFLSLDLIEADKSIYTYESKINEN